MPTEHTLRQANPDHKQVISHYLHHPKANGTEPNRDGVGIGWLACLAGVASLLARPRARGVSCRSCITTPDNNHCATPAINEGCTRSIRISHMLYGDWAATCDISTGSCTPYHPPNIAGVKHTRIIAGVHVRAGVVRPEPLVDAPAQHRVRREGEPCAHTGDK
jgi:hypothetical protein